MLGSAILQSVTVLLSAFLLFLLQPVIGRFILPWFGGTPGVWATCLLFFQTLLVLGYAYAHLVVRCLSVRRQAVVHAALLALALCWLPVTPDTGWKPVGADAPVWRILALLATTVGPPFLLLASTAPLIQDWFARLHPGRSPYRLYALSNLGSLLGLLGYPFLVERLLTLRQQTAMWSVGFAAFAVLSALCTRRLFRSSPAAHAKPAEPAEREATAAPRPRDVVLWLALSACGSAFLLATTNQMCLDMAVVPFLWVLPLALYLLTFILCFERDGWYSRPLFCALVPVALINAVRLVYGSIYLGFVDQMVGYSVALVVCCMCCHGELARLRPGAAHLTSFFLAVAIGGAAGSLFVAVLAPALFSGFYEYPLLLVACALLVCGIAFREVFSHRARASGPLASVTWIAWTLCLSAIAAGVALTVRFFAPHGESSTPLLQEWGFELLLAAAAVPCLLVPASEGLRALRRVPARAWWSSRRQLAGLAVATLLSLGVLALVGSLGWHVRDDQRLHVARERNFYGVLAIKDQDRGQPQHSLTLKHGRIRHGFQLAAHPEWPTAYYGPTSGVGLALRKHPDRDDEARQFRVGVVGLGVGTLAAYANASIDPNASGVLDPKPRRTLRPDYMRFYEINPLVLEWAEEKFTFLAAARARGAVIETSLGDARIAMERQLAEGRGQAFDVLAIDAFNGDAVPVHLLTLEAFRLYARHMKDDGILAIHISNRFLDLRPVVHRLAREMDWRELLVDSPPAGYSSFDARWALLTDNTRFFWNREVSRHAAEQQPTGPLWTDDYSSVFELIRLND